jgi:hypothetical protein
MSDQTLSSPPRGNESQFRDTETKLKVLRAIAEFFCLSARDLAFLLYRDAENIRTVNRTLNLLGNQGLTDWRLLASPLRKRGTLPSIHGLTLKGSHKVEELGYTTQATKIFKTNSDTLLPHEYEISVFHLRLKELCDERGWELYWQQRDLRCSVNPDACFGITTQSGTFWYFLEMEKTKPGGWRSGESKITRNLTKYFGYFNSDACETEWANFRKFRVVVVQRNPNRRTNLLGALAPKHAHRMFWLTTEELFRENIGGTIFLTPKDYGSDGYAFPG